MRKALTLAVLIPALMLSVAGKKDKKKKKKKGNDGPQVGWVEQGGEKPGACFHAPDFSKMAEGPRRLARADAIEQILTQWRGERDDGIQLTERTIYSVESVLLGDPGDVETILAENLDFCQQYFAGGTPVAWDGWLTGLPARLTAGECKGSLLPQTLYDYLNIGDDWHIPAPLCKGDEVVIESSPKDYYKIAKDGPWINTAGDTAQAAESGFPCTLEGCYKGTLLLRFRGDGGSEQIIPIGNGGVFRAPDHGKIDVMINLVDFNETEWKIEGGLQHHTSIGYLPK